MKYRRKPVVFEATQWFKNGDHPDDYVGDVQGMLDGVQRAISGDYRRERGWEGSIVRYFRHPDIDGQSACRYCTTSVVRMHDHGWIDTPDGGHTVCPGDFVITGVYGEHFPCKPDIFELTYDPADPATPKEP